MMDPQGQRLAKAIQAGDRGAFEEFFDHFFARVYAYATRRTHSLEAARAVAEQTLAIALESVDDYDASIEIHAWVLTILHEVVARASTEPAPAARRR